MKIGTPPIRRSILISGIIILLAGLNVKVYSAPYLYNIETEPLKYSEGSGETIITSTIRISSSSFFLFSATISISSGYNPDEDILSYNGTSSISAEWDKKNGVLTLSGFASASRYQTALRSVTYQNTNAVSPSLEKREISFMANDGSNSNVVSRILEIIPINGQPVLSNIETSPLYYCYGAGDVLITTSITVQDIDNANLNSAVIRIVSGYIQDEDILIFTNQNGITGNFNGATGILTLNGSSPVANYQEAIRSIRFRTASEINGTRSISFLVNDGVEESNTVSRNIDVSGRLTADLTGGGYVCSEDISTLDISASFTGVAPWSFTLSRNGLPYQSFENIMTSPLYFHVEQEGSFKILSFRDANCPGDTAGSGTVNILARPAPTAVISGTDTICSGGTAALKIVFTGTAPWTVTINVTGSEPVEITSTTNTFTYTTNKTGTFTLSKLSDALCKGSVSGTGRVYPHDPPTAVISGNTSVCEGTPASIVVTLTGTPPWSYSYRVNSEPPINRSNRLSSPDQFNVYKEGTYTLTAVSDKICNGTFSGSAIVTVLPSPQVQITPIEEIYSKQSAEWVELTATPSGGQFSGQGVIPYGEKWYFITSLPPVGVHQIMYQYRASPESCYGYDTITVRIIEQSAEIEIESNRTRYCKNDAPFLVRGIDLINDTIGVFSISGGAGIIDHHDNTATVYPGQLNTNQYTISYTPHEGTTVSLGIEIGNALTADFAWNMECFNQNQAVHFTNTTYSPYGFLSDTSFVWMIETDSGLVRFEIPNISYTYSQPGIYNVRLRAVNSYGCVDSAAKNFHLKPLIALAEENYTEEFEGSSLWSTEPAEGTNSWQLGNPDPAVNTFSGAFSGEKCWYTNIPGISVRAEESRITGPCFDFRGTEKPTLVAQIWRAFVDSKDGSNIQYSVDDGTSWIPIGNLNDGINWFNGYYGPPGSEKKGWTAIKDAQWKEARHSLDFLKGAPKVQFRVTYSASGNAFGNDGIALDDFQIVERNRMIMIEHFTNSSDPGCIPADSVLDGISGANVSNMVNLQYHTSYPPDDPFNADNPVIPTTRQFYYNLSQVPYAIINGGMENSQRIDFRSSQLNQDQIMVQSLYDSDFDLSVQTMIRNDILYIQPGVSALTDIPLTEISLRIAVIEPVVYGITGNNGDTVFRNVVKDMIPGPAGITIFKPWYQGETMNFAEEWEITNTIISDSLRVIAFLQNEDTREIFQAASDIRGVLSDINYPSGLSDRRIEVYPNPAKGFINVVFNEESKGILSLLIYNITGELVYSEQVNRGSVMVNINTGHLPDGLYMVKVTGPDKSEYSQKFVVTK